MHHSDGDNVVDFCFCQVGTHTDEVPMLDPTTSGVDKNNDATTSVVADNSMKTGMVFLDIVHGNQSPKSVARVNPVIHAQKKYFPQKKQVARFTLAWWNLYLDSCVIYHTAFVTCLLKNVEDADTTL